MLADKEDKGAYIGRWTESINKVMNPEGWMVQVLLEDGPDDLCVFLKKLPRNG